MDEQREWASDGGCPRRVATCKRTCVADAAAGRHSLPWRSRESERHEVSQSVSETARGDVTTMRASEGMRPLLLGPSMPRLLGGRLGKVASRAADHVVLSKTRRAPRHLDGNFDNCGLLSSLDLDAGCRAARKKAASARGFRGVSDDLHMPRERFSGNASFQFDSALRRSSAPRPAAHHAAALWRRWCALCVGTAPLLPAAAPAGEFPSFYDLGCIYKISFSSCTAVCLRARPPRATAVSL